MRRSDFLNMLEGKVPVNREMIREIYELTGVFPYFQSAHLLLLKGLFENGDVRFESQLRKYSMHIADREVLYYLLNEKQSRPVTPAVLDEEPVKDADPQLITVLEKIEETALSVEPFEPDQSAEMVKPEEIVEPEQAEEAVIAEKIVEPEQAGEAVITEEIVEPEQAGEAGKPEEHIESEKSGESNYDTQQTVIESARNSNLLIDEIEGLAGKGIGEDDFTIVSGGHNVLISTGSDYDDLSEVLIISEGDDSVVDDQPFYSDPGISAPENIELLELDIASGSNEEINESITDLEILDNEQKPEVRQIQADLIDRFIIANPRIEQAKEKSDVPVQDISKSSAEGEGGFLTETLARIYISQGYYSKAIEIYEKLSLKYPEKSSYFATRIEKVKEYLKK